MNLDESAGGSSCKGQENGDASNGSERPLKKARFAWQVKGKYHLKNDASDPAKTSATESIDPDAAGGSGSGSKRSNPINIGTEQNLETLGDYLSKKDFNTLDSVIAEPDKSLPQPVTTDKLQYPRYVSSQGNTASNNVPQYNAMTMLGGAGTRPYTEDQCIARWQARQTAKGFVDNSVNRILESWIQNPLPEDDGGTSIVLDVADFINNLPEDNSIENEGILMAISAHGLQNPNFVPEFDDFMRPLDEIDTLPPSLDLCLSPFPSDDDAHLQLNNHIQSETESSTDSSDMSWSYSDDQKNESNDSTPFPLFPGASNFPFEYMTENLNNSNVAASDDVATEGDNLNASRFPFEYNENNQNSEAASDRNNHCDFLDAAVLFAIQSKGLTTFGTDYG